MNDLVTLKSLTNIKPIATLCRNPDSIPLFNKIYFERESAFGQHQNGIVLTIHDKSHQDVLDWAEHIDLPRGTVRVRRVVTDRDLESLQVNLFSPEKRARSNYAIMLCEDVAVFRFTVARWFGKTYTISALTRYFELLRRAYLLCPDSGSIFVPLTLGNVKHVYTSKRQMEEVLYPMAYHFFREDTEL